MNDPFPDSLLMIIPTEELIEIEGVVTRRWVGRTLKGIKIDVFVACIGVTSNGDADAIRSFEDQMKLIGDKCILPPQSFGEINIEPSDN